jgi:hypothetical protein
MLGHCPQPTKQINVIRWFLFYAATCAGCFDRIGVSNYLPRSYTEQLHAVISSLTPPRELVSESHHYTMHSLFFVPEFISVGYGLLETPQRCQILGRS